MPPYTPCLYPNAPLYSLPVCPQCWTQADWTPQEYKAEPRLEGLCSVPPQITILIHYCIHYFLLLLPKLINLWGKNYSIQTLDLLIKARPATICGHPEIYFCRSWSIHFVQNLVSCSRPSCGPGSWCWDCAARSSGNLYLRAIHLFRDISISNNCFSRHSESGEKECF